MKDICCLKINDTNGIINLYDNCNDKYINASDLIMNEKNEIKIKKTYVANLSYLEARNMVLCHISELFSKEFDIDWKLDQEMETRMKYFKNPKLLKDERKTQKFVKDARNSAYNCKDNKFYIMCNTKTNSIQTSLVKLCVVCTCPIYL